MQNIIVQKPKENSKDLIKNPYMGWVVYVEYTCTLHKDREGEIETLGCVDANNPNAFFTKLDKEVAKGLQPSILYLRLGWSMFEPEKGVYAWRDSDSLIYKYIEGAKKRHLQIAFRILLSDDYRTTNEPISSNHTVPLWLFKEPGFEFYVNAENNRTPYYDNKTYLYYYEILIEELAKDLDNPNLVAFADAQGLGVWGEMHGIKTRKKCNKNKTIEKHAIIWTKYFKNILLGATFGGGAERINENTIVPNYKHMVRRDGFGSKWITPRFEKMYLDKFFPEKIGCYAEVCYWHLEDYNYTKNHFNTDPKLNYTGNRDKDLRDYLELCITEAQHFRANSLDARVPGDWNIWTELGNDLINKFSLENGYRLVPTKFSYPTVITCDEQVTINHSWKNTALGFMPITNNQLQDKYKVSFALFDKDNTLIHQYIDLNIEPSWIIEDGVVNVKSTFTIPNSINFGQFKLAVSIVDTANNNIPGINLATKMPVIITANKDPHNSCSWYGSWYVIGDMEII